MTIVAVVLARGGSKGIPLKNLCKVGNVSLVARAIESAQSSGIFDKIVVSTDGDKIAEEVFKYDGVLVIRRPAGLSGDKATSISGVLHVLESLNIKHGVCCLLQPTSPLRTGTHIKEAYESFKKQDCLGSVVSACITEHHPYKCLIKTTSGYQSIRKVEDLESPRQQLPLAYRPNGAIYFNNITRLYEVKNFFNEPVTLYEMSKEDSIDIDTEDDLVLANRIIKGK